MANEPTRDELQQVHDRLRYALFGLHDAISFAITASEADAARVVICSPDGKSEEGAAIPATQVVERCISGVSGNLVGAGLYTESLCDLLFTCGPAFRRARLQIAATGDETAIFVDGSGESHPSYHDAVFGLINAIADDLLLTDAGVITEYRLPDEWQTKPDFLSRAGVWYQRIESLASKYQAYIDAELAIATEGAGGERGQRIPPEFRTQAVSKSKASALLGRPNPDSGVKWLNKCIDDGTILCEEYSRQSFVFDIRDFPEAAHGQLRPTAAKSR